MDIDYTYEEIIRGSEKMSRKGFGFILGLLGLIIVYELFNNRTSLFLVVIGLLSLLLRNQFSERRQNTLLLIALISLSIALFTSRLFLVLLIILILLFIGNNLDFYELTREVFSKKRLNKQANDFVMIDFDQIESKPAKVTRNKWFGDDDESADTIYSWENVNYTKILGNTVFDLGNTLLPKETNIILIRKGMGHTKIIIPEGIAVSLDVSLLVGKIMLEKEEHTLLNENFKWHSKNYEVSDRKIKIIANVLLGELEVIFL